ncbi:MAG: TraB/GumN family protein [Flavobacteriales bacterium]|nr:TraB/GumN family protein [Flavobacteriales bacterium]MBK7941823.1 TraB/GumN family protein [Flavobacteriales bacterium]MBK9700366.1 TraB/GumN family protein [Flavobacteriales bacterium]
MRSTPLLGGVLCTLLAPAQPLPHSLLWRISGPGIEAPAYVLGTVHSRDARAYQGNDSLWAAMAACTEVVGELDNEAAAKGGLAVLGAMQMPGSKALADLYRKKDLERVRDALKEHLGLMALASDRMKPFWSMALLTETLMRSDSALVLDEAVQVQARRSGQAVSGLESMQEQLAAIDAIPLEDQAAMLLEMVRNDLYRGSIERMMDAYARQDLEALQAVVQEGGMPSSMDAALLAERNARMTDRMAVRLGDGCSCFFAIGAAHLPGAGGVLGRLRGKGFVLTPVAVEPH